MKVCLFIRKLIFTSVPRPKTPFYGKKDKPFTELAINNEHQSSLPSLRQTPNADRMQIL
jgi:hypothetical protein